MTSLAQKQVWLEEMGLGGAAFWGSNIQLTGNQSTEQTNPPVGHKKLETVWWYMGNQHKTKVAF